MAKSSWLTPKVINGGHSAAKKRSRATVAEKAPRGRDKVVSVLNSFPRITRTPGVMGGKPCIKGSRMTVGMIVGQIAEGATVEELIDDFPKLKREDIMEAIRYAGWYASDLLFAIDPAA